VRSVTGRELFRGKKGQALPVPASEAVGMLLRVKSCARPIALFDSLIFERSRVRRVRQCWALRTAAERRSFQV